MEDSIRIRTYDGQYRLIGADFQTLLSFVREQPNRRFQSREKIWEIRQGIEEIQKAAEGAGLHVTSDTEMGRALKRPSAGGAPRPKKGSAERIAVRVESKMLAVVGGGFRAMLDVVKAVQGRRYMGDERLWELPGTEDEVRAHVERYGYKLSTSEEADEMPPADPLAEPTVPPPTPAPSGERKRDQIKIRANSELAWIAGGTFYEMLAAVKAIDGRRFVSEDKLWDLPLSLEAVGQAMTSAGYELEPIEGEAGAGAEPSSSALPEEEPTGPPLNLEEPPPFDDEMEDPEIF